jgi:hypothetical protein
MTLIMGDGDKEVEATRCGRFRRVRRCGGSTVREADSTAKSSAAVGEAKDGSGWRLEVEDDQRKLGR